MCNHPCLSYPLPYHFDPAVLVRRCGKFAVLDRILVKLHASGAWCNSSSAVVRQVAVLDRILVKLHATGARCTSSWAVVRSYKSLSEPLLRLLRGQRDTTITCMAGSVSGLPPPPACRILQLQGTAGACSSFTQPSFSSDHSVCLQCTSSTGGRAAYLNRSAHALCRCDAGHRVLLFSTMTKLLDLLESYLAWRKVGPQLDASMGYLRIDGSTSLEDRSAPLMAMQGVFLGQTCQTLYDCMPLQHACLNSARVLSTCGWHRHANAHGCALSCGRLGLTHHLLPVTGRVLHVHGRTEQG